MLQTFTGVKSKKWTNRLTNSKRGELHITARSDEINPVQGWRLGVTAVDTDDSAVCPVKLLNTEWSTLIGRDCRDRPLIALVESVIELKYFHGVATPALLCHKEPACRIQSPLP